MRAIGVPNHATCNKQPIATCNGSHTNVPPAPPAIPTPRGMRHCGGDGSATYAIAACNVRRANETDARTHPLGARDVAAFERDSPTAHENHAAPLRTAGAAMPAASAPHPVRRPHPKRTLSASVLDITTASNSAAPLAMESTPPPPSLRPVCTQQHLTGRRPQSPAFNTVYRMHLDSARLLRGVRINIPQPA